MEAHLHMWLSLLVRWSHFIVGIAWIGASFYFNWLENHLQRQNQPEGTAGDLWAVHGGGFYYLKKFAVAPGTASTHPALVQVGGLYHVDQRYGVAGHRVLLECTDLYAEPGDQRDLAPRRPSLSGSCPCCPAGFSMTSFAVHHCPARSGCWQY